MQSSRLIKVSSTTWDACNMAQQTRNVPSKHRELVWIHRMGCTVRHRLETYYSVDRFRWTYGHVVARTIGKSSLQAVCGTTAPVFLRNRIMRDERRNHLLLRDQLVGFVNEFFRPLRRSRPRVKTTAYGKFGIISILTAHFH